MNRRKTYRVWGPVFAAAVLVLLVFVTGVLDKQRVFEDMEYNQISFKENRRSRSLDAGDRYGLLNEGATGLNLPAGTYRLRYWIDGDGENRLRFSCGNNAAVSPAEVTVPAGEGWNEVEFTLQEACVNLRLDIDFVSGTYMDVVNLRMYSPFYNDHAWTLLFAAILFSVLWVLGTTGRLAGERAGVVIFIGLALLIANSPAYKDTLNLAHDTYFHMARVENLASGLAGGQFPVRAGGYTYNGYGAITSVFYADLFLYPLALMRLMGASITYVMNVYMVAVSLVSAVTLYACARRMFGERWIAACAAILYTLAVYRATNAYTRCAVGEATAMAVLPLFILGLWEVVLGDSRRYATLSVGASCVFLCHMISTLICAGTAFLFCLIHVRRIVREKRMIPLLKAVGLTALLCAFQLAPLLTYSLQGIGAAELASDVSYSALAPAQLFALGSGNTLAPRNIHLTRFSTEIGLPLLAGATLALYGLTAKKDHGLKAYTAGLLLAGGVCFSFAATELFPWSYLSVLTGGLTDYIQFSWRLLMMTVVLLSLAGGYGLTRFAGSRPDAAAMLALCVAALCTMPTLSREMRFDEYIAFGEGDNTAYTYREYTIPGSDVERTTERTVLMDGAVRMENYVKEGTTVTASVVAEGDATLTFPLFGFDGYAAEVEGREMAVGLGENNRLTVHLPAGTEGTLRIWFAGKGYWRFFDAVSLAALAGLLIHTAVEKKRKKAAGA